MSDPPSVGESLLEISKSKSGHFHHTGHEIILPKRTPLGAIQHIVKVVEMGMAETQKAETPQATTVWAEVHNITTPRTFLTEP